MSEELEQPFDEIEHFIHGKMTPKEESDFLQRLQTDKKLFADYQLWVKLDDWLEEIPFAEIEQVIEEKQKQDAQEQHDFAMLPWVYLRKVAALICVIGSLGLMVYKTFYEVNQLTLQTTLWVPSHIYINSPKPVLLPDSLQYKQVPLTFHLEEFRQKDTTYLLATSTERPVIRFRVPRLDSAFAQQSDIRWINGLQLYELRFYQHHKSFRLKPSKQWQRLQ